MNKQMSVLYYCFIFIFFCTAFITLVGISIYSYFEIYYPDKNIRIIYLDKLFYSLIIEVIPIIFLMIKSAMKYTPKVVINSDDAKTIEFMRRFISSGSSVTIVSNRVAWLKKSNAVVDEISQLARRGTLLEIITPHQVDIDIRDSLREAGVVFYVTNENSPPEARFTLVNGHRSGAETLAIARGMHPQHEITIFDNNSGPQIIAMAKDIIRKSKELSRAS